MHIKQLKYFVRVAEMGSFTRASISLNIAQPTLSRQIRLLEVELRQHLLIRDGRGVAPNEAGKLLLEHARGILHQVERTKEELERARGIAAGHVTVGLPPSPARVLSVPLIRGFRQRFPDATLTIKEGLSTNLRENLLNGQLDIALLYNSLPAENIDLQPIREDQLHVILKRESGVERGSITLGELAELFLIIPSKPHALRMLLEREMAAIGFHPKIALEIDSVSAILDLVLDGFGSAVLPLQAVLTSGKEDMFSIHEIVEPVLRSRIALATCSSRPSSSTQDEVAALLSDISREYLVLT